MRAIGAFGKAKTIATDNAAVLKDDAIADTAKLAHHGVRPWKVWALKLGVWAFGLSLIWWPLVILSIGIFALTLSR